MIECNSLNSGRGNSYLLSMSRRISTGTYGKKFYGGSGIQSSTSSTVVFFRLMQKTRQEKKIRAPIVNFEENMSIPVSLLTDTEKLSRERIGTGIAEKLFKECGCDSHKARHECS